MKQVQVDETFIPAIRDYYVNEIADSLGRLRPDERAEMELVLKKIDEEEGRVLRLYAAGMVTEDNWKHLWQEWEDKRHRLRANLERLDQTCETCIESLDHAPILIAKVDILYETLPRSDQKDLLRHMIERVIVNPEGKIIRLELLPPFSYLHDMTNQVKKNGDDAVKGNTKTNRQVGQCSDYVLSGAHNRTQVEHRILSGNTLEFKNTIQFPQHDNLKRLSLISAIR